MHSRTKWKSTIVSSVRLLFFISDQRFLCIFWWNSKQKNGKNSFSDITNRQTDLAVAKVANCNEIANTIFSWTKKKVILCKQYLLVTFVNIFIAFGVKKKRKKYNSHTKKKSKRCAITLRLFKRRRTNERIAFVWFTPFWRDEKPSKRIFLKI